MNSSEIDKFISWEFYHLTTEEGIETYANANHLGKILKLSEWRCKQSADGLWKGGVLVTVNLLIC
jgi:hypothetical protein